MKKTGMIVLGHGSRRREVACRFEEMIRRVAAHLPQAVVLPAFFSLGQPDLPTQIRELDQQGCVRVVIMPYFLYNGVHMEKDIPALLTELRQTYPHMDFVLQPTLENDPAMERLILARLQADITA
jgi:sirohydrochlorin cobaltochelatase